jgi:hypothetical protein
MKKNLLIALALAVLAGATKAQVQFSAGPGMGFNYAVHSTSGSDESVASFSPLVTGMFDMQFAPRFSVLLWVDFYSDMSASESEGGLSVKYKIRYLSFSPALKFCIPGSPFYLFAGPGIGVKMAGKVKAAYEGYSVEESIPDMNTRIDMRFGAGYDYFLTDKLTLSPFVGFNVGLNEVAANTDDWRINTLQAGIVLRFNK